MIRVVRIRAEDSPNVRLGMAEVASGKQPSHTELIPGILSYSDYLYRRQRWDKQRQCIGLDGEFYEGETLFMFPAEWLNRAERIADKLAMQKMKRTAKGIGVDPAEGGDETSMTAVDEWGVIEEVAERTPNTAAIEGKVIAFARKHNCPWERILFDRGGGGKQHADNLVARGYQVSSIGFGESVSLQVKSGIHPKQERREIQAEKYVYVNRRAEMYWALRMLMDPYNTKGFGIPAGCRELRRQLSLIPLTYDKEGRIMVLPKSKKHGAASGITLTEILGCSPDRVDSLVLAIYAMQRKAYRSQAGVMK